MLSIPVGLMSICDGSSFSAADNLFNQLVCDLPWTYYFIVDVFSGGVLCNVVSPCSLITSVHDSSMFVVSFERRRCW